MWAGGPPHDAFFWDTGSDVRLLVAGQWHWWVPAQTALTAGWNSDGAVRDLDKVPFHHGWSRDLTFQDLTASDVAVAPQRLVEPFNLEVRDEVFFTVGDLAWMKGFGADDPFYRFPAYRECTAQSLGVAGVSTDIWSDAATGQYEVWLALSDGMTNHDPNGKRLMIRKNSAGWCFDGVQVGNRASFIDFGTNLLVEDGMNCQDGGVVDPSPTVWPACKTSAFPDATIQMAMDPVGVPRDIKAIGVDVALLVASGSCGGSDTAVCPSGSGEGLWVLRDNGASGLSYTKVDYDDPGGCSELDFFEGATVSSGVTRPQSAMSLHPNTDATTGVVRAFISSRTCGVREVSFILGSETVDASVTWNDIDVSSCGFVWPWGGAALADMVTLGVTAALDGTHMMVFGGSADGSTGAGGGVCEVSLATGSARTVVPTSALPMAIRSLEPHPQLADMYAMGGLRNQDCASCAAGGLYMVQANDPWPGSGLPAWRFERVSGDDFDHSRIQALAWGMGLHTVGPPRVFDHVYAATAGGGGWDLALW